MIFWIGIGFVCFIIFLIMKSIETRSLRPPKSQADTKNYTFEESVKVVEEQISADPSCVADHGHAILRTHGAKVKRSIVFFHGFTNAPRQYEKLAQCFFERGYNIYVPRVPHHGHSDLLTPEVGKLSMEDILSVCNDSIDIAKGLGEEVTVLGLSMGGVMAAWCAQFRDDVEVSVVLVPSFGWYFAPRVIRSAINLSALLPNMLLWWDPVRKDNRDAPFSMYHRFSTRGMGHIMRLGLSVLRASRRQAPNTKKIVIMTNDLDIAVDGRTTNKLVQQWKAQGVDLQCYRFARELDMEHDVIDPLHPYEKTDFVYGKILEYIDLAEGGR